MKLYYHKTDMKLYYHKTDGGAKYLCSEAVEGTNEGNLNSKYIVRIDGNITEDAELFVREDEMKYKILFDNGKPYEVDVNNDESLIEELNKFYKENMLNDYQFDAKVLRFVKETGEFLDISETQFIESIIDDIERNCY